MYGEPVTRRRNEQTGEDRYGEPIFETVDTVLPERAAFGPKGSTVVVTVGREQVLTKDTLFFARQWPDLTDGDKVVFRGRVYDVDGIPPDWRSPWGSGNGGLVVELSRAEG